MSSTPLEPTAFTLGSATGIRFYNGSINAVRIYNRALSDNKVRRFISMRSRRLERLGFLWRRASRQPFCPP